MAEFTRVSGDFKPLMNYDAAEYTNTGANAVTSGATVQPQGPKLDFFTVTFDGTGTTGAQVKTALETIQQLATIHMYEFTTATNDTLAVALYPAGAWTDVTLDTALTAAVEAVSVTASATFTG